MTADIGHNIGEPVAVGGQFEIVGTRAADDMLDRPTLGPRGCCKFLAKSVRASVDVALLAGFCIDDPDDPDVWEVELAWIAHLNAEHVMSLGEPPNPLGPVA